MLYLIQMMVLAAACLIMLLTKVPAHKLGDGSALRSRLVGVIEVFGVA